MSGERTKGQVRRWAVLNGLRRYLKGLNVDSGAGGAWTPMKVVKLEDVEGMRFPSRVTRVLTGEGLLPAQGFTTGFVVIQPKGKVPRHAHGNEEIYLIAKGTGRISVGSEEQALEAFSAVYIEPNMEHGLENTGDEEMIMIFVYSPAGVVDHWAEEMAGKMR